MRRSASASVARRVTLDEDVDVVVGEQPHRPCLADDVRLVDDELLELDGGAGAEQRVQRAQIGAARDVGEQSAKSLARDALIVGRTQRLRRASTVGIDDGGVERHVELETRLANRRIAVADQRIEEERQETEPDQQSHEAERAEHALVAIAASDAARNGLLHRDRRVATHTAPDSGARRAVR